MNSANSYPALPQRAPDTDKSRMGRVLVIAGSHGMAGAAVLATEAALRSGCGYVYVATVPCLAASLAAAVPSAILRTSTDRAQLQLRWDDLGMLTEAAREADALVVGPGLGDAAHEWLGALLPRLGDKPMVLDADALNALARRRELLRDLHERCVLTPHVGEAARLLGWGNDRNRVEQARESAVSQLCVLTKAVVLLKGAGTLVAQRGRATSTNPTGNAGLAKAGSGDVLSGLIGGLMARGLSAYEASLAGAWLHGRAADLLSHEVGEDSYIPSDLAHALGAAMRDYSALTS